MEYIQQQGIESDSDYPYRSRKQICQYSQAKTKTTVGNIKCFEKLSYAKLQQMLATAGPLANAVDAKFFQFYRGGVLQCRRSSLYHGVLLVGFTQDTWIIKNTWRTDGERTVSSEPITKLDTTAELVPTLFLLSLNTYYLTMLTMLTIYKN